MIISSETSTTELIDFTSQKICTENNEFFKFEKVVFSGDVNSIVISGIIEPAFLSSFLSKALHFSLPSHDNKPQLHLLKLSTSITRSSAKKLPQFLKVECLVDRFEM